MEKRTAEEAYASLLSYYEYLLEKNPGMTLRDVARKSEVPFSVCWRYLKGVIKRPQYDTLIKLSCGLEVIHNEIAEKKGCTCMDCLAEAEAGKIVESSITYKFFIAFVYGVVCLGVLIVLFVLAFLIYSYYG